ncbi:MAG: PspC domain-containing protein [Acidimicrobiia bacterium]|nr:PspC domain-containing protein [Acidimicrobiia bacterium]
MSTQHPPRSPGGVDNEAADSAFIAPPEQPHQAPSPPLDAGPTKIYRNTNDKVIAGVCGGLGPAVGIDPIWFRLGFIFLALSSGIGFLLYLIAWIIIPEAPEGMPIPRQATSKNAVVFGLLLLAVGSALFIDAVIPWFDRMVWPVALIGLGVGLIYFGSTRRQS